MRRLLYLAIALVAGCSHEAGSGSYTRWTVPAYRSAIPHVPKMDGFEQLNSVAVEFRKYEVRHPDGVWKISLDAGEPPIVIKTSKGKVFRLASEWYPQEGGADAVAVYGFVNGSQTRIVLQGTSDLTYEETWITFSEGEMQSVKRYAAKGDGMGPEMPGEEPKFLIYPPQ